MLKFNDTVLYILQEEDEPANNPNTSPNVAAPDWLQKILAKHKELGFYDIASGSTEYNNIVNTAFKGYLSKNDVENVFNGARILDAIRAVKEAAGEQKSSNKSDLSSNKYKQASTEIVNLINSYKTPGSWNFVSTDVGRIYNEIKAGAEKQAAAALETYDNDYILPATQKIITKRVEVFNRLVRLKSPTQPFTNLIVDVFKYPEQYIAGQRKVTNDFPDIVDDMSIKQLFRIGLAAKKFVASELTRLKTQTTNPDTDNQAQQTNQAQPETQGEFNTIMNQSRGSQQQPELGINAGLNLFDTFLNTVLIQEGPIGNIVQGARNIAGAAKARATSIDPNVFKKVYADLNNIMNFVTGKAVKYKKLNADGKETGELGETNPKEYTIKGIKNIDTPEAVELIKALRDVAEYTRKKPGVGERTEYLKQTTSGIAGLAGIGNIYGGVN